MRDSEGAEVRDVHYSNLPSRLKAIFLLGDILHFENFNRITNSRPFDILYEVELVDSTPILFKAHWDLAGEYPKDSLSDLENKAHQYWQAKNVTLPEILTLSPVQIIKRLN